MKKFSERSTTEKTFIVLIVILAIGVILRWGFIKSEAGRGFRFFSTETEKTK